MSSKTEVRCSPRGKEGGEWGFEHVALNLLFEYFTTVLRGYTCVESLSISVRSEILLSLNNEWCSKLLVKWRRHRYPSYNLTTHTSYLKPPRSRHNLSVLFLLIQCRAFVIFWTNKVYSLQSCPCARMGSITFERMKNKLKRSEKMWCMSLQLETMIIQLRKKGTD